MLAQDTSSKNRLLWVTGTGGLIGSHVIGVADAELPGWTVRALARENLDLSNEVEVCRRFKEDSPSAIIHCAALSRSPACQADPALANRLNVEAPALLAKLSADAGATLVFLSTDLVFDGIQGDYREEDTPNPLSVYGETKAKAERIVARTPRHIILRTSLNAGRSPTGNRSFVEETVSLWREGRQMNLFVDEYRCPIAAEETAKAACAAIRNGLHGVYHLAGREKLSRHEIGTLLATALEFPPELIRATTLASYSGPPRPRDTSLNCARLSAALGRPMPSFLEWAARRNELKAAFRPV